MDGRWLLCADDDEISRQLTRSRAPAPAQRRSCAAVASAGGGVAATRAANQGPDTGAQHLVSATFRCGVEDDLRYCQNSANLILILTIVVAIVCDFMYLLSLPLSIYYWNLEYK